MLRLWAMLRMFLAQARDDLKIRAEERGTQSVGSDRMAISSRQAECPILLTGLRAQAPVDLFFSASRPSHLAIGSARTMFVVS